ncbi:MAG: tetratricopeptide repeat protein [Verrucomicrobiaceae bacterium]|nr:tetratricopeptide repeat protein [Verrucomicrobiaceae bacterium]
MTVHPSSKASVVLLVATLLQCHALAQKEPIPRARPAVPVAPAVPEGKALRNDREESLIKYAHYVYSQNQWQLAESQYVKFLKLYPTGKEAAAAGYRMAECRLKLDKFEEAEKAYLDVLRQFRNSDYGAPSAYRLGSLYFAREQYQAAAGYFDIARLESKKNAIRLSAAYYRASSFRKQGLLAEMLQAFENLVSIKKNNPYREAALLILSRTYAEKENRDKALAAFLELASLTSEDDIKGEALVKAGLISNAQADTEAAKEHLHSALGLQGGDEWKPDAQFHLINIYYAEKNHAKVAEIYNKGAYVMSEDIRPKMLLMAGNAHRHLKRYNDAVRIYNLLSEHYQQTEEAGEAEYRKLLCFFSSGTRNLPELIDHFILWQQQRDATNSHIDLAYVLKAEYQFKNNMFAPAGLTYDRVRILNIPEKMRASILYKRGWAHNEGKNHTQAITAFGDFLESHPKDDRISNALAKRALSHRATENYEPALLDLKSIIAHHPDSEAAELAYQQSALIQGQLGKYKAMVDNFTILLEKFPDSKATPEAHFWIGWGQFELKEFATAAAALRKARKLNTKAYFTRATLRIILAEYSLQHLNEVRQEVESLPGKAHQVKVPPQVYLWLGIKLFDARDYPAAVNYLSRATTPKHPEATQAVVWKHLAQAMLYTKNYEGAIQAFDFYLATPQPSTNRARAFHDKGIALLALGRNNEAETAAEDGLTLQPQSRVYGMLCLLWGEVALREKRYEQAVQRLIKPTYAIEDAQITPQALLKSAHAHQQLEQVQKADQLRATLKEKFPNFKAPSLFPKPPNDSRVDASP